MPDPRSIPFRDAAHVALSRSLASPATVECYRRWIGHVAPVLGAVPCGRIDAGRAREALRAAREAGLGPKSLRHARDAINLVLREVGCPAVKVRLPEPPRKARALGREEARLLREALQGQDGPDYRALQVLLGSGVRRGEALGLLPDDVEPGGERLHVRGTKTKHAGRVVDLPAWLGLRPGDLPLQTSPDRMRRALRRACALAGVPRIRVHDLRHTRLTGLLLAGAPALYVAEQAGHATPSYTLRVYGHILAATAEDRRRWCNA